MVMTPREEYQRFIVRPEDAIPYHPPRHQATTNYLYLAAEQLGAQHLEVVVGGPRPGGGGEPHYHEGIEQVVFVLQGHGVSEIEGEQFEIGPHTMVFHPPGQVHRELAVTPDFKALIIYAPPLGLRDPDSFKQSSEQK
jgi:quercetin dioxygenase-like cupin family protein